MIRYVLILAATITIFSCTSNKDVVMIDSTKAEADSAEYILADSTEYILIVNEIDFENWLITNNRQIWYHSHEFYKAWNKIYVREFNWRVLKGADHPFNEIINYDFVTDYGIELDYRLYWYFMFIQKKYDVSLFASSY